MSERWERDPDIVERTYRFGLAIIVFHTGQTFGRTYEASFEQLRQLLRAGTAVGALVEEAQGAQSRADFISKMSIAHKEARESRYWLRIVGDSGLLREPPASAPKGTLKTIPKLSELKQEATELVKVLGAIIASAKKNRQ